MFRYLYQHIGKIRPLAHRWMSFKDRHIGPDHVQKVAMLKKLGLKNTDELLKKVVPSSIRKTIVLPPGIDEHELGVHTRQLASLNDDQRTFLGMGYYPTKPLAVIQRNVLENPNWYTPYSPYQSELMQGVLELLYNFQTTISSLTGLPIANSSLLDEATACSEAMLLCYNYYGCKKSRLVVDSSLHPQSLHVLQTFAQPLDIKICLVPTEEILNTNLDGSMGILVQYPDTFGRVYDRKMYEEIGTRARANDCIYITSTDLLALTKLESPGTIGADIAVGSSQRFGVPMLYGGPHAAFMSVRGKFLRYIPGKVVGKIDGYYRMALQTREQHIRREKATSNICTTQCLLASISGLYALYHGPKGLQNIADQVHSHASTLYHSMIYSGIHCGENFFDTLYVQTPEPPKNTHRYMTRPNGYTISLDEQCTEQDVYTILQDFDCAQVITGPPQIPESMRRSTNFLTEEIFQRNWSETNMMRYLKSLEDKNISLTRTMMPLGSCTMKLNAAATLECLSNPGFTNIHPYTKNRTDGYAVILRELQQQLCKVSGLDCASLQPNAGSQGEYAGLRMICKYLGDTRKICLIPESAHGTNPATARRAGMRVIVLKTRGGKIDLQTLAELCNKHSGQIAAIMITYPSTFGFFEDNIVEVCKLIHDYGGQVYLDGANMNAQVGVCNLAEHVDVMHFNLHKTFSIPHGGGGPGVGAITYKKHLEPFAPCDPLTEDRGESIGAICGSLYGSSGILPISWAYTKMLGGPGLKKATEIAILNANYMALRLAEGYEIVYSNDDGYVSHEFIINVKPFSTIGVKANDIVKRLQDYGFHSPTVSWPVQDSLMIEPTESEDKDELDRFCDAMLSIRSELQKIADGIYDAKDNPIKNAPHPISVVTADQWNHKYSREEAAYPLPYLKTQKFWPACTRIDEIRGDNELYKLGST